ncbi:hypothetical protein [Pandoraea cepalis]|uniref:DUF4760 domain-containing protein n=1 Tax=Pandoraea cepalis TaxID=2508294 RepID=A0A5E4YCV5_9BURK|nr:hypothetical protein [Pandoraea cepalis]VVE45993.1 hypothetical protein PCE31107_04418 [Pandoraea cepalis]
MVAQQGPDWLQIVLTSAVVSAALNIVWGVISKYWDAKRTDSEKEVALRLAYQEVGMRLVAFAKDCSSYIDRVSEGLYMKAAHHDESILNGLKSPEFHPIDDVDWTLFDIETVDTLKSMRGRFEECNRWILVQWGQDWMDVDDAFELETQRCAYYALEALRVGIDARLKAKLSRGDYSSLGNLELHIEQARKGYKAAPNGTFIPELVEIFSLEHPVRK